MAWHYDMYTIWYREVDTEVDMEVDTEVDKKSLL